MFKNRGPYWEKVRTQFWRPVDRHPQYKQCHTQIRAKLTVCSDVSLPLEDFRVVDKLKISFAHASLQVPAEIFNLPLVNLSIMYQSGAVHCSRHDHLSANVWAREFIPTTNTQGVSQYIDSNFCSHCTFNGDTWILEQDHMRFEDLSVYDSPALASFEWPAPIWIDDCACEGSPSTWVTFGAE